MTDKKEIKIEFVPGCFDHFEGTQEELDELVAQVQNMFAGKTQEEIEAMGTVITDPDDLPPELLAQLAENLFDEEELEELERMGMPRNRKLQ